jgi:signal peptidase I
MTTPVEKNAMQHFEIPYCHRGTKLGCQRLDASTPHFENVYGFDPKFPPHGSRWSDRVDGTVALEFKSDNFSVQQLFPDANAYVDLPSNSYLVMGDNTCNSLDSRFCESVPVQYVIGKSFFVLWQFTSRFGSGNR